MSDDKTRAHDLAVAWWASEIGRRVSSRGYAICDGCNKKFGVDEAHLTSPVRKGDNGPPDSALPRPEMYCGSCFERGRKAWNPDGSGVFGRPLTPPEGLYPPRPKPFWKFW